jgi:hypothetical protein
VHEPPPRHPREKAEKPENTERRRVDSLKNMMAPDPSLEPAPAPSEPATPPPTAPPPANENP